MKFLNKKTIFLIFISLLSLHLHSEDIDKKTMIQDIEKIKVTSELSDVLKIHDMNFNPRNLTIRHHSTAISKKNKDVRRSRYSIKHPYIEGCKMTAYLFENKKLNKKKVHACTTGKQLRRCIRGDKKLNGHYGRLKSCHKLFNPLDEIKGVHLAINRNTISRQYNEGELALNQTHNCNDNYDPNFSDPNGRACTFKYDKRINLAHIRVKWAQLMPKRNEKIDISVISDTILKLNEYRKNALSHLPEKDQKELGYTLVIMTGKYTPGWLINKYNIQTLGVEADSFKKSDYSQRKIPLPWDAQYKNQYRKMMNKLSYALKKSGLYHQIKLVKVSGIDVISGEQRLMPLKAFTKNLVGVNKVKLNKDEKLKKKAKNKLCNIWRESGYKEKKVLQSSKQLASYVKFAFPDKLLGLAFVHGSERFPSINKAGECDKTYRNETLKKMIINLAKQYGRNFIINSTTLHSGSEDIDFYNDISKEGSHIGFQLNAQKVGCRDEKQETCDSQMLIDAFKRGFNDRANTKHPGLEAIFIEAHDGNIEKHKKIIRKFNHKFGPKKK